MFENRKKDKKTLEVMNLLSYDNFIQLKRENIVTTRPKDKNDVLACLEKSPEYMFPSKNFSISIFWKSTSISLFDKNGRWLQSYCISSDSADAISKFREIEDIVLPELIELKNQYNDILAKKEKAIKDRINELRLEKGLS